MNENQKIVLLIFLGLFLSSIIYVPLEWIGPNLIYRTWNFIWSSDYNDGPCSINYMLLILEWLGLLIISGGLILYFKKN